MTSQSELLIDLGGSNTKLQIWVDGTCRSTEIAPATPVAWGRRGEVTIDPASFLADLSSAIQKVTIGRPKVSKIAITGQMASFLLVDQRGRAVSPIVSWQDERSTYLRSEYQTHYKSITEQVFEKEFRLYDGVRPGLPLINIAIMAREGGIPEKSRLMSLTQFAAKSVVDHVDPLQIPIHVSDAAATGLYDVFGEGWNFELVDFLDIPVDILPPVETRYTSVAGAQHGKPELMIPIGDFQAAIHGVGLRDDEVFIHLATGGQVAVLRDSSGVTQLCEWLTRGFQVRPALTTDRILLAKTHLPAGRLLSSVEGLLNVDDGGDAWSVVNALLGQESSIVFGHQDARFKLSEIPMSGLTLEQLASAMINGIHATFVEYAGQLMPPTTQCAVFSGGALMKLPRFQEQFEEKLGVRRTRRVESDDSSLAGLARLNGLAQVV
jgi:xylulokinase